MNVLLKIKNLQKERGWSTYKLAYEAGLTQSTLSNMFNRNTCPTIDTLQMICDAFGITLSEFFSENKNNVYLSNEESALVNDYRSLSNKEKELIKSLISTLKNK